ncbi:MAG TPA: DUF4166 domain-containing protein [Luteimonas sp.]|nr:DUF4166 domain-containing protein [Luteimonas sp.]HRP71690.1 DUF4166 domain-containing protein [Luteimonas sp.]
MQPTVFQQALGAAFFRLPDSLRRLHSLRGREAWAGRTTIERGGNPLARLCARIAGLPAAGEDVPTLVEFSCDPRSETWRRDFGGSRMSSTVRLKDGLLRERLGPIRFHFALHANDGAIWWTVAGARLFGVLPLPASLFDGVRCREYEQDEQYRFEVEATLPVVGRVIRYSGWLAPG